VKISRGGGDGEIEHVMIDVSWKFGRRGWRMHGAKCVNFWISQLHKEKNDEGDKQHNSVSPSVCFSR